MLATNTEEQPVTKKVKTNPQDFEISQSSNIQQPQTPITITTPTATAGSHNSQNSNLAFIQQTVIPNHHQTNPKVIVNSHPMWNGNANGHAYTMHSRQTVPTSNVIHSNGVQNNMHSMTSNGYVNTTQGYIPMNNSAKINQVPNLPSSSIPSSPKQSPMMQSTSLVHVTTTNNSPVPSPQSIIQSPHNNNQSVSPVKEQVDRSKPSIIPMNRLVIGNWNRKSAFLGDLFCKVYFKKKQFVWEMMGEPMGYLRKISVNFQDVTRIEFSIADGKPATVIMDLKSAPSFYQEINPQPGKNIQWASSQDFTNGQSLISNRHTLHFSKGTLSKHLGKLCIDETLKKVIVSNGLEKVMTQANMTTNSTSVEEEEDSEAVDDEDS